MNDQNPTKQQKEILDLLSVSERRMLLKLKERRGSFGLFEGAQRIGDHLFHPSTVISAHEKGLVGGDHVRGYYLTFTGRRYLANARPE
ncbi:MAG TPA: hypothetical protein VGG20_02175 [Thermoanaerobaculia bacterium]